MARCVITSCTDRKIPGEELLPAILRYDGPTFRVIRKYHRAHPSVDDHVKVFVVSAEYGLLEETTPIPNYDRKMTGARARQLQPQIVPQLRDQLTRERVGEIFLVLGKKYHQAIEPLEEWLPNPSLQVVTASGGMGQKLQQLHRWLYHLTEQKITIQERPVLYQSTLFPNETVGTAIIRGITINDAPEQIEAKVKQWLAEGDKGYLRTQKWVAIVGNLEVAPKWLVSRLSGVPVSDFAADEARRVLRQLGISTAIRNSIENVQC